MELYATINTTSNYKNCNNQQLNIVEFLGTIIACKVPEYGFNENGEALGKLRTADFNIKEVTEITRIKR